MRAQAPYWHSLAALHRFYVARKADLKAAEDQYRRAMAWRARVGADTILQTYREPEVMRRFFPTGFLGCVGRVAGAGCCGVGVW